MPRVALALALVLIPTTAFAQEATGRKVAFLVGVGKFKHDLGDLNGSPQKDVAELARVLKEGGFEVVALTDKDATRADVEKRFREVVKPLGKNDLLLAAFCTHGFTLPPEPGKPDAPFLAAHDSKPGQADTMLPLNGFLDATKGSGATCLFLVDACREIVDVNRGSRGIEGTQMTLPKGTAVLFSCGRGQFAHQSEKTGGHGLFTYAVLRTLRGEAGLKEDVSWTGLVHEVEKAFRSPEFRSLVPPGKVQTPFEAKGELAYTELLDLVVVPLAAELRALRACGRPFGGGDAKQIEHLRRVVPTRLGAWQDAAEKGDPIGQTLYAYTFLHGVPGPKDVPEGIRWYKKAASGGSVTAMLWLGQIYRAGVYVTQDYTEAVAWFRKAADTGDLHGTFLLGRMYEDGRGGLPKSDVEAVRRYRIAAEGGHASASMTLGWLYEIGTRGLPKDTAKAIQFYEKAAAKGHPGADEAIKRIKGKK